MHSIIIPQVLPYKLVQLELIYFLLTTGFTSGQLYEQHGENPPHSPPQAGQANEQVIRALYLSGH